MFFQKMEVHPDDTELWWKQMKHFIRTKLDERRNNCGTQIKAEILCEYCGWECFLLLFVSVADTHSFFFSFFHSFTVLKRNGELPTLSSFKGLRSSGLDTFKVFCKFVRIVYGKKTWDDECHLKKVSSMVTVSDEAFALLELENFWDGWASVDPDEYDKERVWDNEKNCFVKRKPIPGKWTSNPGGSLRYSGWNEEGIAHYNSLFDLVRKDREDNAGIDDEYLQYCKETKTGQGSNKRAKGQEAVTRVVARVEDLDGLLD
jgi:hypothetical protein